MLTPFVVLALIVNSVIAQDGFKCPHEYGFYPHQRQCDKYYKCENNQAELKTCGNGLAFDSSDPKFLTENCDYLHNVDCGDRTELEPPIGSPNCPRLYGIFPDEVKCDTFWSCWNGEANRYTCAPGLAYDRDARVCMWADQVPECKVTETEGGFKCPNPKDNPNPGTFSRHAHPDDCRKYYICLDGSPREYGCPIGTVYQIGADQFSGQCTDPEGVEGCENYYGDDLKALKKSELLLGLSGDNGSGGQYSVTQKSATRKKIPQSQKVQEPVVAPQQQQSARVQQVTRVRPTSQQQQQQQARPVAATTARPVASTAAPKPAVTPDPKSVSDDYYYYDNYDDTPVQPQSG